MSTYFDLFYRRLQEIVARYSEHLSDAERRDLSDVSLCRQLFADLPAYVSAVPGLADALEEFGREERTAKLLRCFEGHMLARAFVDMRRISALPINDKDDIAAALAAFYYLAVTAQADGH